MERRSPKSHIMKIPVAKSPVARSPMHKSLMPRSPMPKSPMPKSPVPRSPVAYEKYKSRCAYGLISFFRFRHRHSKKMISDTCNRSLNRHSLDDQPRMSDQYIHNAVDEMTVAVDSSKGKPNKIKKDTGIEKQIKKKITTAKVENVQSDSEHARDPSSKHGKTTKTSWKPRRLPIYGCYDVSTVQHANSTLQIVAEKSLNSLESPATVAHPESGDCSSKSNEINLLVNLNEATEAFINQKLIDGRHISNEGSSHESKHFLDALEVLNSNKDLFVKLLQDPNSLLVKQVEDWRDSEEEDQHKKLSTEFKALEHQRSSLPKDSSREPLENIVILKPRQNSTQYGTDKSSPNSSRLWDMQQSIKPFEQMKKKLMRAMRVNRKKRQSLLTDFATDSVGDPEKYAEARLEDISLRNSPDKAALDIGDLSTSSMDAKRKTLMDDEKESNPGVKYKSGLDSERELQSSCLSPSRPSNSKRHDLFVEPRIDISELKNGNTNLTRKQRAKTWDGTSSVPDYSFLPMISPGRTKENGFVSPQWRFPSYGTLQIATENHSSNQKDKKGSCLSPTQNVDAAPSAVYKNQYEKTPDVPDNLYLDVRENESNFSSNISINEIETNMDGDSEQAGPSGISSISDSSHGNDVNQSIGTMDACEEHRFLASPRTDSSLETQTSNLSPDDYSSSPSNRHNFKEFDIVKDNTEQPSPISVLDQFFTEDANSPINAKSKPMWQLQIGTEEVCFAAHQSAFVKIDSITSKEEHGSMLNYISGVLQASRFTWDELSQKCQISDQMVDLSLFEDIRVGRVQSFRDCRLLFDYVNEVVLDAYACYSRCSPWLSFVKPSILPSISMAGNIVHEMMKCVDHDLFLAQASWTLEQIIGMDLNKSRTWMDIRLDAEDTVCEIIDDLLDELTAEVAAP